MANQILPLNVLDPMYTRYIPVGSDLEQVLVERYGDKYDFEISHQSDRWVFRAPEELDRKQLKRLSKEVVARVEKRKAEEAQAAAAATTAGAQQGGGVPCG
ncbi:hypothetical protein E6O75_ATG11554 [Venturia nashicola]|uniref:Uncharacterized protein n=1 Tax=Venturia nashicola TaxID=86259 RepID=A0A4Z1NKS7_9PEZI|nr:hypothetical protein E6O75_ATG11554 [Venturia nashicola]